MDSKDHDMLIKLDTKMTIMCSTLTKMNEDNNQSHKEIYELVDKKMDITNKKMDNKVDFRWFKWVVGIIAGFMIVFGTWQFDHITSSALDYNSIHDAVQHLIDDSPHNINIEPKK